VVRGLAYYTGVVFEAFDRTGGITRAICGGGRYDRLFSTYGARVRSTVLRQHGTSGSCVYTLQQDIPCCGFGFGDCVIMEILESQKLLPAFSPKIDDIILSFNEELRPVANNLAMALRLKVRPSLIDTDGYLL